MSKLLNSFLLICILITCPFIFGQLSPFYQTQLEKNPQALNQPFEYKVLSNDGKSLYESSLSDKLELNLSKLSNGIYFIQLTNDSKTYEFKVSKID